MRSPVAPVAPHPPNTPPPHRLTPRPPPPTPTPSHTRHTCHQVRDENVEAQVRALGETVGLGARDVRAMRGSQASYASIERQLSRTTLPEPEHWPSRAQVAEGRQGRLGKAALASQSRREPCVHPGWSHRASGAEKSGPAASFCACRLITALARWPFWPPTTRNGKTSHAIAHARWQRASARARMISEDDGGSGVRDGYDV